MKITKITKDSGFASRINSKPYVGVFGLTFNTDDVSYRLEVDTPGSLPGEKYGDRWREDGATIDLHRLTPDFEKVNITSEEAELIAEILRDIVSGERVVVNQFNEPVNMDNKDLLFIESLIEKGASLFETKKIVTIGEINQLHSQVERPLPRA